MENNSFYELLLSKKDCGIQLDFDKITYDELYELSFIENIPDSIVGDLFRITKEAVRKKRYKLGIKL
ncbi:hypothetical protein [Clostridium ljungdahlii]|uniref:Uncharacterized protein n=1 Tax=Clostridium ljungdahlii TaxID=1538 RepID=A0A168NGV6_9CLOT|nr:hypothetical protein [Clostridium ljungdahlii]OAA86420.1 hypothetical protein WY13_02409 [Clostridium ljungdahlii]